MNKPVHAYLLLSLAVFFWGGNVIVARALHDSISAIALSSGRWFLATLLIVPFALPYIRREWTKIRRHWFIISILGLLGVSLFNTLLYQAAHTTTSTNIALIQTTMPAMIVLIVWLFYNEKISGIAISGVIISIAGAMLVVSRGNWQAFLSWDFAAGDLWMLLANFFYALYSVLMRRLPKLHPLSFLGTSFIIGSLILLPLFAWDLTQHPLPTAKPEIIGSLLYVAVFPSIISYLAWNRGVELIGASLAGFFICLIPVFTAILAAIFLDEKLYWYHLLGMLIILIGFLLFQHRRKA